MQKKRLLSVIDRVFIDLLYTFFHFLSFASLSGPA